MRFRAPVSSDKLPKFVSPFGTTFSDLTDQSWLATMVDWVVALRFVGVKINQPVLPAIIKCLICDQEQAVVYPDIYGGQWIHCRNCNISGDCLEILAKSRKLTVTQMFDQLKSAKAVRLPAGPSITYYKTLSTYAERLNEFRQGVQQLITNSTKLKFDDFPHLEQAYIKLSLRSKINHLRWNEQLGRSISIIDQNVVAMRYKDPEGVPLLDPKHPSHRLVIPFYDMPGRVAGLLFYEDDGNKNPWTYHTIPPIPFGATNKKFFDPGVGFYNSVLSSSIDYGNTAFITDDPQLALLMHSKWFQDYGNQLPLILLKECSGRMPRLSLNMLPKRDWVILSEYTPDMLKLAADFDASLYNGKLTSNNDISIWLHNAAKEAVKWPKAVVSVLSHLDDLSSISMYDALETKGVPVKRVIEAADQSLVARLSAARSSLPEFRTVEFAVPHIKKKGITDLIVASRSYEDMFGFGKVTVLESKKQGWFIETFKICDAIIRINTIQRNSTFETFPSGKYKSKNTLADAKITGDVIYNDVVYPFATTMSELIQDPYGLIISVCVAARVDHLPKTALDARLHHIFKDLAILFSDPRIID